MAGKLKSIDQSKKKWTSEDYANDSEAANKQDFIVYDHKEDLDSWLEANSPLKVSRDDGIGWILIPTKEDSEAVVEKEKNDDADSEEGVLNDKIRKEWEDLKQSGESLSLENITRIAKKHDILGGCWLFHIESDYKVDVVLEKLAHEFIGGSLTNVARSICMSPLCPNRMDPDHVIMISHDDFTNEEEVFKLENAIRQAGVKYKLLYKPDIYGILRIYRNNDLQIKPTIYASHYDAIKKKSTITPTYDEVWDH